MAKVGESCQRSKDYPEQFSPDNFNIMDLLAKFQMYPRQDYLFIKMGQIKNIKIITHTIINIFSLNTLSTSDRSHLYAC